MKRTHSLKPRASEVSSQNGFICQACRNGRRSSKSEKESIFTSYKGTTSTTTDPDRSSVAALRGLHLATALPPPRVASPLAG